MGVRRRCTSRSRPSPCMTSMRLHTSSAREPNAAGMPPRDSAARPGVALNQPMNAPGRSCAASSSRLAVAGPLCQPSAARVWASASHRGRSTVSICAGVRPRAQACATKLGTSWANFSSTTIQPACSAAMRCPAATPPITRKAAPPFAVAVSARDSSKPSVPHPGLAGLVGQQRPLAAPPTPRPPPGGAQQQPHRPQEPRRRASRFGHACAGRVVSRRKMSSRSACPCTARKASSDPAATACPSLMTTAWEHSRVTWSIRWVENRMVVP